MPRTKPPSKKQLEMAHAIIARDRKAKDEMMAIINRAYVGKFYVYDNSYNDDEHWPLYAAITDVDEFGSLKGWTIQLTTRNTIKVDMDAWCNIYMCATEISAERFFTAVQAIQNRLWMKIYEEQMKLEAPDGRHEQP